MAQPPDIGDTFVREVDENLRRDQLRDFFRAYGSWLIAAVILFLAASGGLIWWRQHQAERPAAQVEEFAGLFKDIASGNAAQVPGKLDQLADSGSKGIRASAMFARAALAIQQGDIKTAIATYKSAVPTAGCRGRTAMPRSSARPRSNSTSSSRRRSLPGCSPSPSPASPGSEALEK